MMETAQVTCPCRHKETWWWNEEVAERKKKKHTQPFYCWSGMCPGPPGSAGTRKVKARRLKPIWIYWSKR